MDDPTTDAINAFGSSSPAPTVNSTNPADSTGSGLLGFITALAGDATQVAVAQAKTPPASGISPATGKPATAALGTTGQLISGVDNSTLILGGGVLLGVLLLIQLRK